MNLKHDISNKLIFMRPGQHPWGLQNAIYKMYKQLLDKSQRLNAWSQGLYRRAYNRKIQSMIQYAANDCLSATKLAATIKQLSVSQRCLIMNMTKYFLLTFNFSLINNEQYYINFFELVFVLVLSYLLS